MPQEARLSQVRYASSIGSKVAAAISYALDNQSADNSITETEMYEVLADFLVKPEIERYFSYIDPESGYGAVLRTKEFNALWNLVPRCGPMVADLLIRTLPTNCAGWADIPEEVMASLSVQQLELIRNRISC